jgi:hypothetical protein
MRTWCWTPAPAAPISVASPSNQCCGAPVGTRARDPRGRPDALVDVRNRICFGDAGQRSNVLIPPNKCPPLTQITLPRVPHKCCTLPLHATRAERSHDGQTTWRAPYESHWGYRLHSRYLKVSACLKHFSAYSQETGRLGFAANVTATDMEDTYLPAFEAGVRDGNASGIMCSYVRAHRPPPPL